MVTETDASWDEIWFVLGLDSVSAIAERLPRAKHAHLSGKLQVNGSPISDVDAYRSNCAYVLQQEALYRQYPQARAGAHAALQGVAGCVPVAGGVPVAGCVPTLP